MNDEQFIKKLKSLGATREEVERSFSGIDKGFSRQEVVGQFKKYKAPKLQQEAWRMEEQRPQRTVAAQQESFNRLPAMDRALAGAGKTLYSTTAAPVKRLMGQGDEARETIKAYDTASQGDFMAGLGEYGTDIGLSLMPGAGAARALKLGGKGLKGAMSLGAMEGIGSAGVHQLQRFGETGDISPMEAAIETGASTVLPGLGNLVGRGLKKVAPEFLRSAVKPVLAQVDVPNPPNFKGALDKKIVGFFGGLDRSQKMAVDKISKNAKLREVWEQLSTLSPDIEATGDKGVIENVVTQLKKMKSDPKSKMTSKTFNEAMEAVEYWKKELTDRPTYKNGVVTAQDAVGARKGIDAEIDFRKVVQNNTPGFDEASNLIRKNLNKKIRAKHPEIGKYTDELADVIPYEKALSRRLLQQANNYKVGLLDVGSLGVGGALGGYSGGDNESKLRNALIGASLLGGGRRLTSTPGGAAMLYSAGQRLMNPSKTKSFISQAGRTGGYESLGGQ